MNAQTRREMATRLRVKLHMNVMSERQKEELIDATLCEWGLEMAKIAEQLDDYNNVGIARRITAANDQQKSVNKKG